MTGNLWGPDAPLESEPIDLLIYRSRLLGSDPNLLVWGGGNTSTKTVEPDHRGRMRQVLRIKGSGTDLKSIDRSGFPGIFRDDILALLDREEMTDEEMVAYLEHCMVEPSGPRPSIETLLHGFLPARHVDHTHADAIVTLTNTKNGREVVREALGDGVAFVPYRRPGFALARDVYRAAQDAEGVVLEKHGLVTWGETARESYSKTIELVERAERWLASRTPSVEPAVEVSPTPDAVPLLLRLRARLGTVLLHTNRRPDVRAIADRPDASEIAEAGPATPDHTLRIKPWACLIDGDPAAAIDAYESRYRSWFERHAGPELAMLSPLPRVFLVPGLGLVTAGRNARDARILAEVAWHTLSVAARGTDALNSYRTLPEQDLFDIEYWPLELYKLTLAPAPGELEGRIVIVTGAGSGIGRAVARHLARLDCQTVLFDINPEGMDRTAVLIREDAGTEPLCCTVDVTNEGAVGDAVTQTVLQFGGIDGLVSNAGIGAGGTLADLELDTWRRSMEINATSHFIVTAEVLRIMREQKLGGSLVYVASKNAFGPGAGFGAYSAAKAAQVQLARIAALEGGPHGIRSNIVNPDAIFEDSGLWSEQVRRDRAEAHGVPVDRIEEFYAQRNLLKTTVSGRDVAEAVAFLLSDRARATTGTVITVDGGVAGAFPR